MEKRRITILGSTGSIGTQTLDVIRRHRDMFEVETIAAGTAVVAGGVSARCPSAAAATGVPCVVAGAAIRTLTRQAVAADFFPSCACSRSGTAAA